MQIKLIPAVLLFLGSYFPLALILAVQDVKAESWARRACRSVHFWNQCDMPELANPGLAFTLLAVCALSPYVLFVGVAALPRDHGDDD